MVGVMELGNELQLQKALQRQKLYFLKKHYVCLCEVVNNLTCAGRDPLSP